MVVVEPVIDHLPIALARDEAERAEAAKLVAHGRLGHAERGREVARAERAGLEGCEEPESGRVAERGKERAGAVEHVGALRQMVGRSLHRVGVDTADGAGVGIG